jgi:hypothetical protein
VWWWDVTSALGVLDFEANSLGVEYVDIGSLNHGAVTKETPIVSKYLLWVIYGSTRAQLWGKGVVSVQLPIGRGFNIAGDLEGGSSCVCFDIVGHQLVSGWVVHKLPEIKAERLRVRGNLVPSDVHCITV